VCVIRRVTAVDVVGRGCGADGGLCHGSSGEDGHFAALFPQPRDGADSQPLYTYHQASAYAHHPMRTALTLVFVLCCGHQLSWTERLDEQLRQCDMHELAQASKHKPSTPTTPSSQPNPNALSSRAESLVRDYFHHLPHLLTQSGHTHFTHPSLVLLITLTRCHPLLVWSRQQTSDEWSSRQGG
jgi:hypothetical protein